MDVLFGDDEAAGIAVCEVCGWVSDAGDYAKALIQRSAHWSSVGCLGMCG